MEGKPVNEHKTYVQSKFECWRHNEKHQVGILLEHRSAYERWDLGLGYVTDIPGLTAGEREILLTGTCDEAWDSMFAKDECAEDCDGSSHPGLMCK